ncbi:hypothetical protein ACFYW8_19610 [Streptomyces sp. NPDC002742]|jgi:hypothetical protein|uniref:hypothetical protein n=1 Tax=unclassified Streptomyces TaxID=2593676 RepID=UPI003417E163
MSASESAAVPASERDVPSAPRAMAGVSMRDLLAACAAAEAVSRPPRAPLGEPGAAERPREAA